MTFAVGAATVLVQVLADSVLVHRFGAVGVGWGAALAAMVQMGLFLVILAVRAGIPFIRPLSAPLAAMFGATVGLIPVAGKLLEILAQAAPVGLPGRFLTLAGTWLILQVPLFTVFWWRRKSLT